MTYEQFNIELREGIASCPKNWRKGQKVFNVIDRKFGVARDVQFIDGVDCFYDDRKIKLFISKAWERINDRGIEKHDEETTKDDAKPAGKSFMDRLKSFFRIGRKNVSVIILLIVAAAVTSSCYTGETTVVSDVEPSYIPYTRVYGVYYYTRPPLYYRYYGYRPRNIVRPLHPVRPPRHTVTPKNRRSGGQPGNGRHLPRKR